MFTTRLDIHLHHTDAAGRLFFAQAFTLAHVAYERLLARSRPLADWLAAAEVLLPIVHAEADFHQPLTLGQSVTVQIGLERLGSRSFTLQYDFLTAEDAIAATVHTVHVAVDRATGRAVTLPDDLRTSLEQLDAGR